MSSNVIGKFRNAEFIVTSNEHELGRRSIVHEYPLRDKPYVEDNGKKAGESNITVVVMGKNFKANRDKLIEALNKPGPGTLMHPDYGTLQVSITSARLSENTKEIGKAIFNISFITGEAKPRYPLSSNDTPTLVNKQADKSIADSINDFANAFDVAGLVNDQIAEVQTELDNIILSINDLTGSVASPVAGLIRTPFNLGTALAGSVSAIGTTAAEPKRALNLYSTLFTTGNSSPIIPQTTVNRKQQAKSTSALHNLIKRSALIEACRSSSQAKYDTYDDAVHTRNALLDELDTQMRVNDIDDVVYLSLLDLRVTVVNDIGARGADLSRLTKHTPLTTLPALVIAHQLYGNAIRADEIIARNNIRHPGFVTGGTALEVLVNV